MGSEEPFGATERLLDPLTRVTDNLLLAQSATYQRFNAYPFAGPSYINDPEYVSQYDFDHPFFSESSAIWLNDTYTNFFLALPGWGENEDFGTPQNDWQSAVTSTVWTPSTREIPSSIKPLSCDWPPCSSLEFITQEEQKRHIKCHAHDVRTDWKPSSKCSWYRCSSKACHKDLKSFENHLNNIHVNPLVCTVESCTHGKPFRGKPDLQRHIDTAHGLKRFRCRFEYCGLYKKQFSRKDKWMSHVRDFHDTQPCPYDHCRWEVSNTFSESLAKHLGKTHGNFECALKVCKGSVSHFSEKALAEHLQVCHNIGWNQVLRAKDAAKATGVFVLGVEHIPAHTEVFQCSHCSARN